MDYGFIKKLCDCEFIDQIWLFGSRARGDNTERSDIDLAIICPRATHDDWYHVLEIITKADTLLKIDCVRFDTLADTDKLKHNILQFKQVLYVKGETMDIVFWKDYFDTWGQAIGRLAEVIHHPDLGKNEYMQDAAIQRFEFVMELCWKVLKKVLSYEKIDSTTPRDVLNKAFQYKIIDDEKIWLKMLDDRNCTSHVYKQEEARRVFANIKGYLPIFEKTYDYLKLKYHL
jgi:nucleotidyltransferase substrate binding protein (TIGR01987 family)